MLRIRINGADNDPFYSRRLDGVGAGRGASARTARFERDVKRRAARIVAAPLRVADCFHFGVWPAGAPMPALPDDVSVLHQHRADHRVG